MGTTRDRLRSATHAKVLAAADALFLEQGFAATTVRDIAASAGVSVGTVMAVGDKSGLLVAIFDRLIEQVHLARRGSVTEPPSATGVPCAARVMSLLTPFLDLFTTRPGLARAYASILVAGNHSSTVFTELSTTLVDEIRDVLEAGGRPGTRDPTSLATAIYFAYVGALFGWAAGPDDEATTISDRLCDTITTICSSEDHSS
ncbi:MULTISPECIES: TetR/AcrR family transcriptional regulator [Actinoalloteichus]|uniref:TetR/AcrR family transcriptional regulator n=1 Tax=Actinoalloteichus TaxID=65496 RepID=UPI00047D400E|nr:TetR/AcrR family transcriptional regulator [Actinoalloteichus caeruleus]